MLLSKFILTQTQRVLKPLMSVYLISLTPNKQTDYMMLIQSPVTSNNALLYCYYTSFLYIVLDFKKLQQLSLQLNFVVVVETESSQYVKHRNWQKVT